ncbi:hypothetical protein LEP1GSC150_0627 [Leptospira interrogans serovar Copenhageni str. LT2050]|uniref:Uncharacterized protein n=2 Tax=Leptospira interrogans TaxID=173 RepID=M6HFX3_LEPIR|nr:hypothetical protein LEP1GSC150_0627 [Leptospira interrogans serovar Copenhageni str. LT2050]EMM95995.1 hypothetical protein LEP1GSC158_3266 [Leptospira interrogans serovar Zanoni str. LT2156]
MIFALVKIGDRPFPPEPSPQNLTWQLLLIGFGLVNGMALVFIPLGMYGSVFLRLFGFYFYFFLCFF